MKCEVRCGCGNALTVSAADAGSALRCACGRTVDVPPLHMLRTAGGAGATSPLSRIRAALLSGLLPGTRACSVCGTETDKRCRVKIACERVPNQAGSSKAEVLGCLLAFYIGWLAPLLVAVLRAQRKGAGDEEAVIVPLPVCEACRSELTDPNLLQVAVRRVPAYAALLDHYPQAQTAIVG